MRARPQEIREPRGRPESNAEGSYFRNTSAALCFGKPYPCRVSSFAFAFPRALTVLKDLDSERLQVSASLVDKFVASEFHKTDTDGSGGISFDEFTTYVTDMTRWMRAELIAQTHHKHVFSTLAARALEVNMPPVPPFTGPNLRDGIGAVVLAPKYGVRLELPHAAHLRLLELREVAGEGLPSRLPTGAPRALG